MCHYGVLTVCVGLFIENDQKSKVFEGNCSGGLRPPIGLRGSRRRGRNSRSLSLFALVDRDDLFSNWLAHILTQWPIQAVVFQLFEHLRAPASTSGNGENWGEQVSRNT